MLRFDNKNIRRKNPIKRNTMFFSSEDFGLEMEFKREYMENDANQTVILYQVDMEKTKVDEIYYEAKKNQIRFKDPVELTCVYEIADAELKGYGKDTQRGVYSQVGKLTVSILNSTLEEMECDVHRGDYIGVQITPEHMEYFVVTDDGRVNSMSNKFSMYGTMPYARTIICSPVDKTEFNG